MSKRPDRDNTEVAAAGIPPRFRPALLQRHRWIPFLLPFLVFMLINALEPTRDTLGEQKLGLAINYSYYPLIYTTKIALTVAAVLFVLPGYREFPFRIGLLGPVVGAVGIVVWVGLCHLEQKLLAPRWEALGLDWLTSLGARSAYNPFEHFSAHPVWAWGFLAVRFLGLVLVVAVIEEFFLRGFLIRFVIQDEWWKVPVGKVNAASAFVATVVPVVMHPAEWLAAAVWFSMVTWLYAKTRNIWDCVAAHAITNLLLGIYVVATGEWELM